MRRALRTSFAVTLMLAAAGIAPSGAAAAIGPYTFPFYDPSIDVNQGYGCTSLDKEAIWSGTNADGIEYDCSGASKWFHKGIDFDTGNKPVAASAAGIVKAVYNGSSGSTCGTPSVGNYVIVKHDSTHFSMYYHLKHNSIVVAMNDTVSAGQRVGTSGNTGNSCGAHLHYVLSSVLSSDSPPAATYVPNGKWTTAPGRVPFLATYHSESSVGTDICYGATVTHWVKFKNTGGRTWSTTNDAYGRGRLLLYSTTNSGTTAFASQFAAADWESTSIATPADQSSVAPDGIGTFTFGLKGNGVAGNSYVNEFNLFAYTVRAFDYATLGNYEVPIFIVPPQAC